jgi:hypothetical protein
MALMLGIVALVPVLAQADAVKPLPANGRLAYVRYADPGCVVGLWDSKTPDARKTVAAAECPKQVSLTAQGRVLVLVGEAYVQTYDLASGVLGAPMPLPAETAGETLDEGALLAAYTQDGILALQVRWFHRYPANYWEKDLFLHQGDAWVAAERLKCSQYDEDPCPFKRPFHPKALDGTWGQGPGEIWNDALAGDPYVVKRIPDSVTTEALDREEDGSDDEQPATYARFNNAIVFHVYGRYTKLEFGAEPGEDVDPLHTFSLRLVAPDNQVLDMTDGQFDAVIVGHYLVLDNLSDHGARLYDVGNGKLVLDDLIRADWLP